MRAKLSNAPYMEPLNSALDCTFPKDSEFDLILPIMRNATSLDWTMPSTKDGFDPTTANTARFLLQAKVAEVAHDAIELFYFALRGSGGIVCTGIPLIKLKELEAKMGLKSACWISFNDVSLGNLYTLDQRIPDAIVPTRYPDNIGYNVLTKRDMCSRLQNSTPQAIANLQTPSREGVDMSQLQPNRHRPQNSCRKPIGSTAAKTALLSRRPESREGGQKY
ncbi:hypothetical protein CPB85DRAFT_1252402 [Mucidula mucida]|nr:hypothetical protein CPB85DRAFT_1252402 [Mucidula mucida]